MVDGAAAELRQTAACVIVRELMQRDEAATAERVLPPPSRTGFELTRLYAAASEEEVRNSSAQLAAALNALQQGTFAEEEYGRIAADRT